MLLLPHGHEGQGPDHTSGRIERFLQLWAEGSMTIAVPSTPANYFHLLRRHALDGVMRPLIVFTPKSMLRNKAAVSDVRDFTEIKFRSVLEEPTYEDGIGDRSKVTRILLTSGPERLSVAPLRNQHLADDKIHSRSAWFKSRVFQRGASAAVGPAGPHQTLGIPDWEPRKIGGAPDPGFGYAQT